MLPVAGTRATYDENGLRDQDRWRWTPVKESAARGARLLHVQGLYGQPNNPLSISSPLGEQQSNARLARGVCTRGASCLLKLRRISRTTLTRAHPHVSVERRGGVPVLCWISLRPPLASTKSEVCLCLQEIPPDKAAPLPKHDHCHPAWERSFLLLLLSLRREAAIGGWVCMERLRERLTVG